MTLPGIRQDAIAHGAISFSRFNILWMLRCYASPGGWRSAQRITNDHDCQWQSYHNLPGHSPTVVLLHNFVNSHRTFFGSDVFIKGEKENEQKVSQDRHRR